MTKKPVKEITEKRAYAQFLDRIKARIRDAQIRTYRAANRELIGLYWNLGKEIAERQEKYGWGKAVVERLAEDLREELSHREGFSPRNLWDMRRFYLEYRGSEKLRQLVAEIPWGQNLLILNMVKDDKARAYYLAATRDMGWSRNVLLNQIKGQAFERHVADPKQHSFRDTLPAHFAEQADEAMKDTYMLDFLEVKEPIVERQLEIRLVERIKDFILELGRGFAYIGNQYRLTLSDKEYFVDLLFFNRILRSLVAVELKAGPFKAEYAGKMNLYLNILDDFVREPEENPTIGLILCADRDRVEVDYALRGIAKPVGVAKYELTRTLPKSLKGTLPDPKRLESAVAGMRQEKTAGKNAKATPKKRAAR